MLDVSESQQLSMYAKDANDLGTASHTCKVFPTSFASCRVWSILQQSKLWIYTDVLSRRFTPIRLKYVPVARHLYPNFHLQSARMEFTFKIITAYCTAELNYVSPFATQAMFLASLNEILTNEGAKTALEALNTLFSSPRIRSMAKEEAFLDLR